jgi:hypothetical protein
MPDEIDGGGTTPPAAGAAADAAAGTTPSQPTTAPGSDELAQPSKREWVEFRKDVREVLTHLRAAPRQEGQPAAGRTPAAQAAPAAATPWGASEQLAFRDAIEESEIKVTVAQRKVLERLYRMDAPTISDPIAWVRENTETLGWRARTPAAAPVAAAPAAAAPAPARQHDPGAPTGTAAGTTAIPDDPALLPQSVIDKMTPAEAKAHWQRWQASQRGFRHPFAAAREAERAKGNDLQKTAEAVVRALSGK